MTIRPFDAVNYLRSDAEMAAYLATVMEDEDPVLFAAAIEDIARAKGCK